MHTVIKLWPICECDDCYQIVDILGIHLAVAVCQCVKELAKIIATFI